jgi:hypothetical protein
MKYKFVLIAVLLPAAVFAQSGQNGGGNAGYQGTMSAKDGLGAAAPMGQTQGQGNAGYQGTMRGSQNGAPGAQAPGGNNQNQGNAGYQGTMNGSRNGELGAKAPK